MCLNKRTYPVSTQLFQVVLASHLVAAMALVPQTNKRASEEDNLNYDVIGSIVSTNGLQVVYE